MKIDALIGLYTIKKNVIKPKNYIHSFIHLKVETSDIARAKITNVVNLLFFFSRGLKWIYNIPVMCNVIL